MIQQVRSSCHRYSREAIRQVLGRLVQWDSRAPDVAGYTIILPVPWDIRHLLKVNLEFVSRADLREVHRIHVIFDRSPRPGAEKLIEEMPQLFPHLPLEFSFHPRLAGKIAGKVNSSAFYHALSGVSVLGRCRTRYAVLHDFDLYPLVPNYFSDVYLALRDRKLGFAGHELSRFDGLQESDRIIGTWCLGMDVAALRRKYRAVDCFHKFIRAGTGWRAMDPFTFVESLTPERDLVGTVKAEDFCHARNLCSTYLQFISGQNPNIVWRLHYLWYLNSLAGDTSSMCEATEAMEIANSSRLQVGSCLADFSRTDPTCANVLEKEVHRMEHFIHGRCRPEIVRFLSAFEGFLKKFGAKAVIREEYAVAEAVG